MDRISGLPDEILCHTLSFLSSNEAAVTSLLSKRWRDLFAFTPNLRFEEKHKDLFWNPISDIPRSFCDFVDRVLAVSCNSPVKKFSLRYRGNVESTRINHWICNVLSRGGFLDLLVLNVFAKGSAPLPLAVFTCKTLVKLDLGRGFVIPVVPKTASLPTLKSLFLNCIRFHSLEGRPFETLLSACHVLEELTIFGDRDDDGRLYRNVSCPTLERLTINCNDVLGLFGNDLGSTTFDTPRLTYLDYRAYASDEYQIVNLDSLVEAKLELRLRRFNDKSNPTNLIKKLGNVHNLNLLSFETCQVFSSFGEAIPVLENLSRLSIRTHYNYWQLLPLLLKNSPKLHTLIIEGPNMQDIGLGYGGNECPSGYAFLLLCPVKVIEINRFWGSIGELGHLQCLLEKLPCLELVKVSAGGRDEKAKLQLATDMLMLPKACKIQLTFLK